MFKKMADAVIGQVFKMLPALTYSDKQKLLRFGFVKEYIEIPLTETERSFIHNHLFIQ